jgi:Fe-S cluster assembly protein SufD
MTQTIERATSYRSHLESLGFAADEARLKAFEVFEATGIPTLKHEEWKYTNLRALNEIPFEARYPIKGMKEDLQTLPIGTDNAIRIVLVNGVYESLLSSQEALPKGLEVVDLAESDTSPYVNENPFVALNAALWQGGVAIRIAQNAVIEKPIMVVHIAKAIDRPMAIHPRIVIEAQTGSQAKILEAYFGRGGITFTNAVTTVSVAEGALVEHTRIQEESENSFHIASTKVVQNTNSAYTSNNVSFGGMIARNDIDVWVGGEHCETILNGAYMAFGEQLIDNHTRIDHAVPNCHSTQVYKGILGDKGTGVFNGKIYVHQDAQKTDAKQSNKALLLSKTATIDSKPQLEIFADDVKCTHGATVGQLDEEQLFYLRSRGLNLNDARSMLTFAFVSEGLSKISIESVRKALENRILERVRLSDQEA